MKPWYASLRSTSSASQKCKDEVGRLGQLDDAFLGPGRSHRRPDGGPLIFAARSATCQAPEPHDRKSNPNPSDERAEPRSNKIGGSHMKAKGYVMLGLGCRQALCRQALH